MNSIQMVLPGLENFKLKREPGIVSHEMERLKGYFMGYVSHDRKIFAKRAYIAEKLGWSVRKLARYLKHLSEIGWMKTIKREPRTAHREVSKPHVPSRVPSQAPVSLLCEGTSEAQSNLQHHSEPSCARKPDDVAVTLAGRTVITNPDSEPLQEAVKRVGLQTVLNAIWLGCTRKMVSMSNGGNQNKISSSSYFLPVIQELENTTVSQSYFDHSRAWVRRIEATWRKGQKVPN